MYIQKGIIEGPYSESMYEQRSQAMLEMSFHVHHMLPEVGARSGCEVERAFRSQECQSHDSEQAAS